jgi:hypothetical protein
MAVCACGREIQTENDIKRGVCFACHIKGVRLGFTYGKKVFHGPTEREQQRFYEDSKAFKEGRIEKVPSRAELI